MASEGRYKRLNELLGEHSSRLGRSVSIDEALELMKSMESSQGISRARGR